jgi:2-polyprenyl-3-methyl-5-hydroxy-6-metoxy-1,4-benzoquinol methylase
VADAFHYVPAHMARYRLAARYVAEKHVCDIACGVGHGTCFLGRFAREVIGVDVSQPAIDWASRHFPGPNISYIRAAGDAPWPFPGSFDVIVSLETLEHTAAPDLFLRNIHERLTAGGVLVLSVPNGARDQARTANPFHLHHFTQEQLRRLLEPLFARVQYFSQTYRKDWRHYGGRPFRRLLRYHPHRAGNYGFTAGLQADRTTWVAIAVKTGAGG